MARFRIRLVVFLLVFPILMATYTAACRAQKDNRLAIDQLLLNHDPRLIALGAWEAGHEQDDHAIAIMEEMVEHWDPFQRRGSIDGDGFDAMTVVLDTLIQQQQTVTPAGVAAIGSAFPDQAMILAARLPFDDVAPILLGWYQGAEGLSGKNANADVANRLMLARVSAMMLAKKTPQQIAASLLADSTERLAVSVPNEGAKGVDRCLVGCYGHPLCMPEVTGQARPGWPPIFQYILEENKPHVDNTGPVVVGRPLVDAGGDHITYRRVEAATQLDYCYSPVPLSAETRHHLLAGMLGIDDKQMPWAIQMNLTLPWMNDQQFLSELSSQMKYEEVRLRATVEQFFARGLVTRSQMDATRPKLSVTVFDDRQPTQPQNQALPHLAVQDARTTYRISSWR